MALIMNPRFRPIRKQVVMCSVQACGSVATFIFNGIPDPGGRPSAVAAYCDRHAEEAAVRTGLVWRGSEPKAQGKTHTRVLTAG